MSVSKPSGNSPHPVVNTMSVFVSEEKDNRRVSLVPDYDSHNINRLTYPVASVLTGSTSYVSPDPECRVEGYPGVVFSKRDSVIYHFVTSLDSKLGVTKTVNRYKSWFFVLLREVTFLT